LDADSDLAHVLMGLALNEALLAAHEGEVPTGAVVASGSGEVIFSAHNRVISLSDPSAHAEMLALRGAGEAVKNFRLTGLILFSTLEPCPMCLMAAVHARLSQVIYGAREPKWGAAGSVLDLPSLPFNHSLTVTGGLRAGEAAGLMTDFFRNKRMKLPQG
jgi:tRNA(Arg) A34 adenosine deaminase TadA